MNIEAFQPLEPEQKSNNRLLNKIRLLIVLLVLFGIEKKALNNDNFADASGSCSSGERLNENIKILSQETYMIDGLCIQVVTEKVEIEKRVYTQARIITYVDNSEGPFRVTLAIKLPQEGEYKKVRDECFRIGNNQVPPPNTAPLYPEALSPSNLPKEIEEIVTGQK